MKLRAVLWDFGGVLTASPFEAFARFEQARGLPAGFLQSINRANPDSNAWARFERSEISPAQFDRAFAAESRRRGHEVGGAEVIALLAGALRPAMVAALDRCKQAGFLLGCITNNVAAPGGGSMTARKTRDQKAIAAIMARFDHVIESSKAGLRKPDPRIYRMACAALAIRPEEAVYLDDLGVNLKPARAMGMTTIKVVSPEQALAELEQALGIELRG